MGGPATLGPHETVAEGDRARACTLSDSVTTWQVKLCERGQRMALLLLGVEQRSPRWRRQVDSDTLALLTAVLLVSEPDCISSVARQNAISAL